MALAQYESVFGPYPCTPPRTRDLHASLHIEAKLVTARVRYQGCAWALSFALSFPDLSRYLGKEKNYRLINCQAYDGGEGWMLSSSATMASSGSAGVAVSCQDRVGWTHPQGCGRLPNNSLLDRDSPEQGFR